MDHWVSLPPVIEVGADAPVPEEVSPKYALLRSYMRSPTLDSELPLVRHTTPLPILEVSLPLGSVLAGYTFKAHGLGGSPPYSNSLGRPSSSFYSLIFLRVLDS